MKIQWKPLLLCLAVPLIVGGLAAFFTRDSMQAFAILNQPPLSPPGWLFPVVWTVLYLLMGVASYLVVTSGRPYRMACIVYAIQLFFNFFWPLIFFNLQAYWAAFVWLLVLWILIVVAIVLFYQINRTAAYLLLPYLAWVTFAGYLNAGIALLN